MMLALGVAASLTAPELPESLDNSSLVQQCGQLSPAGTGSQTLSNTLHALRGSSVHSHTTIPDAPCYFMTLRDPARRLESGFRYEVLNPRGGRPRLSAQGFSNVSHFVPCFGLQAAP
eukprot:scaffold73301_cov65-Phaeocystis_antarctica.AAC.3